MAKITIRHCKYKIGGKDFSLPPICNFVTTYYNLLQPIAIRIEPP